MANILGRTRAQRRKTLAFYGFISPVLIGWAFFLIGPLLYSFFLSFTKYDLLTKPVLIGFGNYITLATDPRFLKALYNTGYFVVFNVPLSLSFALILALLLHSLHHAKSLFRAIFYMPAIVPAVPGTMIFIWLLNYRYGLINSLIRFVGLTPQAWMTDANLLKPSLIFITLWGFGSSMLIFLAGLESIPKEYYEASSLDGASSSKQFWRITLPLLSPSLLFVFITKLIGAFQVFTQVYMLGGGGSSSTIGGPRDVILMIVPYLYNQGIRLGKFGYASAIAWTLALIIMVFSLLSLRVSERHVYYETSGEEG
jgi:multiple sugar transport system permease protein